MNPKQFATQVGTMEQTDNAIPAINRVILRGPAIWFAINVSEWFGRHGWKQRLASLISFFNDGGVAVFIARENCRHDGRSMFLHVTNAHHVAGHRVHLSFNDETSTEIDLSGSLDGPIFEPLRDVEYFKSFSIVGHTLAWPNGADFAPEYLQSLAANSSHA